MKGLSLFGLLCGVTLSGCGGGQSGSPLQEQTVSYGRLTARLAGTAQTPVVASSLGSVVTGVAGANITSLTLSTPSNTLSDTRIAFYPIDSQSPGLYLVSPFGGDPYRAWSNVFGLSEPSWSRDGGEVISDGSVRTVSPRSPSITDGTSNTVFIDATSVSTNPSNINVVFGDGSVRNLTTTGKDTNPAWWPASRICFESWRDGNSEIYVMNADGTAQTRLTNNVAADTSPCWSPDGSSILFVSNRNGKRQIFQMLADGSSQTLLIGEATGDCWDPQFSPDGSRICYVTNKDGNSELYVSDAFGGNRTRITTNTVSDFDPSWSPDGTMLCFTRLNPAGFPEVWTGSAAGNNLKQIGIADHAARPYWSPYATSRTLIGPLFDGIMGQAASGFLYGQKGDVTTSVVVFNTVTPSGARISALTAAGVNTPNFVFEVTATDTIRSLQFANDFYRRPEIVIASAPEAPSTYTGALVTFNATTGKVSSVLPYTANRSAATKTPAPSQSGNTLTIQRRFAGIFDATGKNLAPNGAAEVKIDTTNGKLISFQ